jgi:hypothetical protein
LIVGANPVQKVQLIVTGYEGTIFIDTLDGPDSGGGPQPAAVGGQPSPSNLVRQQQRNEVRAVYAQVLELRRDNANLRSELAATRNELMRVMGSINANVRRIRIAPTLTIRPNTNNNNNYNETEVLMTQEATLSPTPKNLYLLWQEYVQGIGGRKPAKDFSPSERGACKFNYARRKIVWDAVNLLIRAGYTAQVAIDKIYDFYGRNKTTSFIIDRMRADRQQSGIHPDLLPPGDHLHMVSTHNRGNRRGRVDG